MRSIGGRPCGRLSGVSTDTSSNTGGGVKNQPMGRPEAAGEGDDLVGVELPGAAAGG